PIESSLHTMSCSRLCREKMCSFHVYSAPSTPLPPELPGPASRRWVPLARSTLQSHRNVSRDAKRRCPSSLSRADGPAVGPWRTPESGGGPRRPDLFAAARSLFAQDRSDPADRIVEGLLGDLDGGIRVTGVDGVHESALMLEQRIERLGGDLSSGPDELVRPAAHPQRADRLDEHGVAGGGVDGGQQLLVVIEVRRGVAGLKRRGHRRELLVEPGPPFLGELLHAFDGRVDLEDPA